MDDSECGQNGQSCSETGCDPATQSCEQDTGKSLPVGAETGAYEVSKNEADEKNRRTKESFTGVGTRGDINLKDGQQAINAKRTQVITPTPESAGTGADIVTEAGARSKANEIRRNFVDPQSQQIQPELDLLEGQKQLDEINRQKVNIK